MSSVTNNSSYSNAAVNSVNEFFRINPDDGTTKSVGKAAGRATTQQFVAAAAVLETLASFVLTVVLGPILYFVAKDKAVALKNNTIDSFAAIFNAEKGTIGYTSSSPKKEVVNTSPAPTKSLKDKTVETLKNNKKTILTATVLTVLAGGVYFFGVPSFVFNTSNRSYNYLKSMMDPNV